MRRFRLLTKPHHFWWGSFLLCSSTGQGDWLDELRRSAAGVGAGKSSQESCRTRVSGSNGTENSFHGPHYVNADLNLSKKLVQTERVKFQLGANAFNVFNHPNFAPPNNVRGPAPPRGVSPSECLARGQIHRRVSRSEPKTSVHSSTSGTTFSMVTIPLSVQ
jgi:hypothetical protein